MSCTQAPVFSLFKRCLVSPSAAAAAAAATTCTDEEILLPNFSQNWDTMYRYPWEAKRNTALMRGSLQRTMFENSTRYVYSAQCGRNCSAKCGRNCDAQGGTVVPGTSLDVNLDVNQLYCLGTTGTHWQR